MRGVAIQNTIESNIENFKTLMTLHFTDWFMMSFSCITGWYNDLYNQDFGHCSIRHDTWKIVMSRRVIVDLTWFPGTWFHMAARFKIQ